VLAVFDFDLDFFRRGVAMVNQNAPVFIVSCRTGEGLAEWVEWLVKKWYTGVGKKGECGDGRSGT
jgi:Ni2+-binding GTPase involved in maturation of urease and hydrogenase